MMCHPRAPVNLRRAEPPPQSCVLPLFQKAPKAGLRAMSHTAGLSIERIGPIERASCCCAD
jgi:hypothetical protein